MTPLQANGLAVLAAFAWGIGNVAQKTVLEHVDPLSATGMTALVGAVVLAPLARRETRAALPAARGGMPLLLVVSVLFTVAAGLMQFGYGLTSVTNAGFLVNTAAVLTPVLAWACLRQKSPAAIWLASPLALAGVFLMTGASWSGLTAGDGLALLAALGFAAWTLAAGLYVMRYRRPFFMTSMQLAICGMLCLGLGAASQALPPPRAFLAALPEILFIGLISKGLAYALMAIAQQHVSATCIGVLVSAEAVFGAIVAALVLGETLSTGRAIGSLCIVAAVLVAARVPQSGPSAAFVAGTGKI